MPQAFLLCSKLIDFGIIAGPKISRVYYWPKVMQDSIKTPLDGCANSYPPLGQGSICISPFPHHRKNIKFCVFLRKHNYVLNVLHNSVDAEI